MKATIYDVAKKAGVSIATVSRVVSGRARVTEATRARVLEAVEELNYRPNPVAQGLALQSTRTLALIIERFDNVYPALIVGGAEAEAREHGYHLLVQQLSDLSVDDMLRLAARADGLILSGSANSGELAQSVVEQGTPVVILGRLVPGLRADGVVADNYGGAREAVEHLIGHGYQRIAHIAGPADSRHAEERLCAYQDTLEKHGLAVRQEYIIQGSYSHEGGYKAACQLLELAEPPEAVFCADDLIALGAMMAAEAMGYVVPDDLAIVGFDGLETGAYVNPPLTSVYQPMEPIGREAVKMLLWRIENPEEDLRETVLPTELLIRRSCGCPASVQAASMSGEAA